VFVLGFNISAMLLGVHCGMALNKFIG